MHSEVRSSCRLLALLALLIGACEGGVSAADAGVQLRADATAAQADAGESAREAGHTFDDAATTAAPARDAAAHDGGRSTGSERDGSAEAAPEAGTRGATLSERHPGDVGLATDPAVLFHDDFESGWGRWDAPTADTAHLTIENDPAMARDGSRYLRSTVTTSQLEATEYISSSTRVTFERRVDALYYRFYARFPHVAPNPHHWVRVAAGNASYNGSGRANTVPPGDQGFWFDFDADNDDRFNFYAYWYRMRSGRCNDGSATPGCAGDQGSTYYYGNVFQPPGQTAFPRDRWFCVELYAKANTVGSSDGALAFWIDGRPLGDYRPGYPEGTWLRAQFHTGGCTFSACTPPRPFEGFDFRSSTEVGFKSVFLDAYYERASSASKRQSLMERGLTVSDEQTILYDDVVAATERIGCAVPR